MALVESRRKAMASSLAEVGQASTSEGLVVSSSKPSEGIGGFVLKTIGGVFGGLGLKTIDGGIDRFRPKNRGVADRQTRGGISKLASRRSKVEKALGLLDRREKTWTVLPIEGIWVVCFM